MLTRWLEAISVEPFYPLFAEAKATGSNKDTKLYIHAILSFVEDVKGQNRKDALRICNLLTLAKV